jgi:hypothetical protein
MSEAQQPAAVLVFLHVPRTAGTTLSRFLRGKYRRAEIFPAYSAAGETLAEQLQALREMSAAGRDRINLVLAGHAEYGQHEALSRPARYLSVLRDPVDRVVSSYRFLHDHPKDPLYPEVVGQGMSLTDFVASPSAKGINDWQTRCLAGVPWSETEWTPAVFDRAKENVERDFLLAGLTERFPETVVLLSRLMGWRNNYYATLNTSKAEARCSEEDRRLILEHNQLDLKLYDFASERLNQQLALFSNLNADLRRLELANGLYTPLHRTYRKVKRRLKGAAESPKSR